LGFAFAKIYFVELLMVLLTNFVFTGCKAGYFGWGCRFHCDCLNGGDCDSTTGHCETGCPDGRWGIGCLLGNCFSYVM